MEFVRIVVAAGFALPAVSSVALAERAGSASDLAGVSLVSVLSLGVTGEELAARAAEDPPAAEPAPADPASFWEGWKRNFDVGLNGSEGNSESLSFRARVGAQRKVAMMESQAYLEYVYSKSDGKQTKSRGEGFFRNDYSFADTDWGLFVWNKAEYDEFQAWDWRLSTFVGPSYTFIKDEQTTLRGRVGVGLIYETGGDADEKITPEGNLGVDYAHTFKEGHKLFASADYFPSLDDIPAYRLLFQAGYEILLSKESNMLLKLGVTDRYDSSPGLGIKRNDLEYFVTLSFAF
ncbi:MAG: DUF481 domain-containing protein [Phycisphaeraceae bacterium]|nr:MAG: DUF481 domain-containing protein [Phycisphaeraceae bacterium]